MAIEYSRNVLIVQSKVQLFIENNEYLINNDDNTKP